MNNRKQTTAEILRLIPLLLVALIAIYVFNALTETKKFPETPIQITLDKDITLITGPVKEEHTYALHKGETVSYLGFKTEGVNELNRMYVQTIDGIRGCFDSYLLGYPVIHTKSHDTVTIIATNVGSGSYSKARVRYSDGHEGEVNYNKLGTILPYELRELLFASSGACYLSESKFQDLYVGQTLDICDKLNHPALFINRESDGTAQAYYGNLFVFKPSEGLFYHPIVYTDNSSVITDYKLVSPYGNNKVLLKILPFAQSIIDCNLFASVINNTLYSSSAKYFDQSTSSFKWTYWVVFIVFGLFGIIWIFCSGLFILLILKTISICRWSFYPIGNRILKWVFGLITLVCVYIWFVLIMTWGLIWPLALVMLAISLILFFKQTRYLSDVIPHGRCVQCRRVGTMQFIERVFIKEYDEWREEDVRGDVVSSGSKLLKTTWTETTYSDGSKKISDKKEHTRDYQTYLIHHYSVLYHVKLYHDIFICSCCDKEERRPFEDLTELERKRIGVSTVTETQDHVTDV